MGAGTFARSCGKLSNRRSVSRSESTVNECETTGRVKYEPTRCSWESIWNKKCAGYTGYRGATVYHCHQFIGVCVRDWIYRPQLLFEVPVDKCRYLEMHLEMNASAQCTGYSEAV